MNCGRYFQRVLWILLVGWGTVYCQLTEINKLQILERVESLYKVKSFQQALNEIQKVLVWDPENIAARYWEAKILLEREEVSPNDTHFDLIIADMNFLDTVRIDNSLLKKKVQDLLQRYHQQFAKLIIRIPDAPLIGYYVGLLSLKFIPPVKLSPLQKARLAEINAYLDSSGVLYFDKFNPQDSLFECHLLGFPIIPQRMRTVKYKIALPNIGDTLKLVYNRSRRKPLVLSYKYLKHVYYQLPPKYSLFFLDAHESIRPLNRSQTFLQRKIGKFLVVLVPIQQYRQLFLGKPVGWKQRGILWGSLVVTGIVLWQLAR